jgi:hypothetical protein
MPSGGAECDSASGDSRYYATVQAIWSYPRIVLTACDAAQPIKRIRTERNDPRYGRVDRPLPAPEKWSLFARRLFPVIGEPDYGGAVEAGG